LAGFDLREVVPAILDYLAGHTKGGVPRVCRHQIEEPGSTVGRFQLIEQRGHRANLVAVANGRTLVDADRGIRRDQGHGVRPHQSVRLALRWYTDLCIRIALGKEGFDLLGRRLGLFQLQHPTQVVPAQLAMFLLAFL